jgi:hypothetical protein
MLIDGFSHQKLMFKPREICMEFVVDILALVYVFLGLFRVSSVNIIQPMM